MSVDTVILITGLFLLIGILSSKFSARLGMPVLVLFLGVGMLAGSEGVGGIHFENYEFANKLGSLALALILFDGGLRTSLESVRWAWKPAFLLSTVGVFITSLLTGIAAAYVLNLPLFYGMLLGSIIGSTDAAAVFSILRTSGLRLPDRLKATLEVESGSNDPMAIFLTIGLIGLITGENNTMGALASLLIVQFGLGSIMGLVMGYGASKIVNHSNLDYAGLYPVMVFAFGLLIFGLTDMLGGSGFLAVYLAGIILGNNDIVFQRGIFLFHDAAAWLGQILLFIMLGLLSFPSQLASVAGSGLLIAIVLTLAARPIAVLISILPFRLKPKELLFISWVGLKGAVPITLATFPLMAGVDHSLLIFNVVFFVVLVSAITQGWSIPVVARWLGLSLPSEYTAPISVEITSLRKVEGEIVDYTVGSSSRVAHKELRDLALPYGVAVTLIVRGGELIIPRGATALRPGDHVFVAMQKRLKPLIDCLLDPNAKNPPLPKGFTIAFDADITVGKLQHFFCFPIQCLTSDLNKTLSEAYKQAQNRRIGPFQVASGDSPDLVTLMYVPESIEINE
jgi:potassium/hydrogen antiporter